MTSCDRAYQLFCEISDRDAAEWHSALQDVAARAPELVVEVRALLGAVVHNQSDGFLECPIVVPPDIDDAQVAPELANGQQPVACGPFTVVQSIASSGTSTVYLAQQSAPVKRLAALKVLTAATGVEDTHRRFLAERAAIAMMQHPHIAQFFDSGVSPDGRLYFAMEYVDGLPINEYCVSHGLSQRDRLSLFLQVCEGVAHAHQRGIIHRDLKPSNILVAETAAGPGLAKVIDFGIAKSLEGVSPDAQTLPGLVLGTLAYMSPEQLRGDSGNIGTQSDVFALGLVLYEVLTGERPSGDATGLKGIPALRAESYSTPVAKPQLRQLGKDLAAIIVKATATEVHHRYESVRQLATDIDRALKQQPVFARRRTAVYVASRFIKRHRSLCIAALLSVLLGVCALAYAWRAKNERASLALDIAGAWLNEALNMGRAVGDTTQREPTVRRLLVEAERLQAQFPEDVRALSMLAASHTEVGSVLLAKGKPVEAREHFAQALSLRQQLLDNSNGDFKAQRELSLAMVRLGDAIFHAGDTPSAMELYRRSLGVDEQLVQQMPGDLESLDNLGWSYERMAAHADDVGEMERFREAQRATFEKALKVRSSRDALLGLSAANNSLAVLHLRAGKPCEEEAVAAAAYARAASDAGADDRYVVFASLRAAITVAQSEPDVVSRMAKLRGVIDDIQAFWAANSADPEAVELWLHAIDRARWSVEHAPPDPSVDQARRCFDDLWAAWKHLGDHSAPPKSR